MLAFRREAACRGARVLIAPLSPSDVDAAAAVLAEGFSASMGYPAMYRAYLERHIGQYLAKHIHLAPRALVLGARLLADDCGDADSPPGSLVGSVELSLAPSTRTRSLTLNPPADGAYICNMAVAPDHRGRGVGAALLAAADDAAVAAGARTAYLHLRLKDAGGWAGRLYSAAGYSPDKSDPLLLALVTAQDRRHLMKKALVKREEEEDGGSGGGGGGDGV